MFGPIRFGLHGPSGANTSTWYLCVVKIWFRDSVKDTRMLNITQTRRKIPNTSEALTSCRRAAELQMELPESKPNRGKARG